MIPTIGPSEREREIKLKIEILSYLTDEFISVIRKEDEREMATILYGDGVKPANFGEIFAKTKSRKNPLPFSPGKVFVNACRKAKGKRC